MMRVMFCVLSLLLLLTVQQAQADKSKGKVLVVLSSADTITLKGGVKHKTGFFLNELGVPLHEIVAAGFTPVFADPLGNTPAMDKNSDSVGFFGGNEKEYKEIKAFVEGLTGLKSPEKLSSVIAEGLSDYAGVFIPGGHAPMEDLSHDPDLGRVLRYFHEHNQPTALICHGPIALLSTLKNPDQFQRHLIAGNEKQASKAAGAWTYKGYKMTIFSTAEEESAEKTLLGAKVRFYPESALKAAGGQVEIAGPSQSQVVVDRELITGQNPNSDSALAKKFIAAMSK